MLTLEEYEKLNPRCYLKHNGVTTQFSTPTTITKWRVENFFHKEPCTVEWLSAFAAGEVLVDVGANVGMYSVWAAAMQGARVFAFEPEAQNYAALNRNLALNNLGAQVSAYCIALSDKSGLSALHLSRIETGASCHSLEEPLDFKHEPMTPVFSQGCVAARLDDLVASGEVDSPHYIKIDVDGFEPKVVAGARKVLTEGRVKSLLIEINPALADHREMIEELEGVGFKYDPEQVKAAERRGGDFKGVAEYVFKR